MNTFSHILIAEKSIAKIKPLIEDLTQKQNNWYNLRIQGLTTEQELKKQILKEHLLRNINPSVKSKQNTQSKFGNVVTVKSTSTRKSKSTTLEFADQVTPPNTSAISPTLDYNIVEEMKKSHMNISPF